MSEFVWAGHIAVVLKESAAIPTCEGGFQGFQCAPIWCFRVTHGWHPVSRCTIIRQRLAQVHSDKDRQHLDWETMRCITAMSYVEHGVTVCRFFFTLSLSIITLNSSWALIMLSQLQNALPERATAMGLFFFFFFIFFYIYIYIFFFYNSNYVGVWQKRRLSWVSKHTSRTTAQNEATHPLIEMDGRNDGAISTAGRTALFETWNCGVKPQHIQSWHVWRITNLLAVVERLSKHKRLLRKSRSFSA